MNKKVAIYIRVSTEAQREEGYSIEAQKESLTAYCISKHLKNYEYYIDGGYTGSNLNRPQLERLISDVTSGTISAVMVYKLDRLSRSQKDTLYLIEDVFNPYGVDFISLQETMDTSTPLGRLMLGILSAFAQLERENIRERTRMGMRERVKSGLWMGGGRIPFGYDYDPVQGILIPNEDADTVRMIYELYLKGFSTAKIATMVGLKYEKLALQILTRKSNAGYIIYNGQEYQGKHQPLISLETYQRAMDLMSERARSNFRSGRYLLTGLLICGKCGSKMRYQKWGKEDCKLVCYSQDKSKPHMTRDPNCDNQRLWASEIEHVIINDLFSFSINQQDLEDSDACLVSTMEMLKNQKQELHRKLKRLYSLYAADDDDALLDTINHIKNQMNTLNTQMENQSKTQAIADKMLDTTKTLSTLKDTWEYMEQVDRVEIVRSCVEKIVLTDDKVEIFYKIPTNQEDVEQHA